MRVWLLFLISFSFLGVDLFERLDLYIQQLQQQLNLYQCLIEIKHKVQLFQMIGMFVLDLTLFRDLWFSIVCGYAQQKHNYFDYLFKVMSALGIWNNRYEGGPCYAACMETFTFYNPSIAICWKGCDYATGRVNDDKGRDQARRMCKRFTSESMGTEVGELQRVTDLRVHSQMFPTVPQNIYRACLAGTRRQRY